MPYHRALEPLHKDSNAFGDENQNEKDSYKDWGLEKYTKLNKKNFY